MARARTRHLDANEEMVELRRVVVLCCGGIWIGVVVAVGRGHVFVRRRDAGREGATTVSRFAAGLAHIGAVAPPARRCRYHAQRELLCRHATETYQC